jgi:hypothetical protein
MDIIERAIKIGMAKYDNTVPYKVEIIVTNFKPGSGDYEDPPEIQTDQFGTFYMIKYYSPPDFKFSSGGGWYSSLGEAVSVAEKMTGGIIWEY